MKISVTEYTREDGVTLFKRQHSNNWTLRSICGPSWFWDKKKEDWILVVRMKNKKDRFKNCAMTEKEGLKLLKIVPKKEI